MTETNNNQESIIKDAMRQFADATLRGESPDIDEIVKKYPDLEHQMRLHPQMTGMDDGLLSLKYHLME